MFIKRLKDRNPIKSINRISLSGLLFFLFQTFHLYAQPITDKEANIIIDHAKKTINEFAILLNTIVTGTGMEPSDMDLIIQNSFSQEYKTRCFFDGTASLDDDVKPKSRKVKRLVQPIVKDYLEDVHNFYIKTDTNSVFISNIKTSRIKKDSYIYVKVYFDYLIKNQSIIPDAQPYEMTRKVAELRVEKVDNKWHAWIVNIHFITESDNTDVNRNDIDIVSDTSSNLMNTVAEKEESDSSKLIQIKTRANLSEEDKKRIQRANDSLSLAYAYNSLITDADKARKDNDTSFALQRYHEAYLLKPDDSYAKDQMKLIERQIYRVELTPQQQYEQKIQKALVAETERKYDSALNYYRAALKVKPDDPENHVKEKIQQLSVKTSNINRIEVKYKSGQYKEAIDDCKSLIKKDAQCTDYYLLMGKCHDRLNDYKKAKEAYLKAISLDATNVEAYKMCGAMYERLNDRPNAIANYSNASNLDKNDANLYLKLASLKWSGNQADDAIHDLDNGIEMIPQAAGLYQKKGEILYKKQNYTQAEKCFSLAIERDPGNSSSFYYRGLAEVQLNKITSAGDDFTKARSIGLDSSYQNNTLSIASDFYNMAMHFVGFNRYDSAIVYLNYSVLVNPSKSEYRFTRGECFFALRDFENAILNYTEAIQLKNTFFEAYRQRGRARMNEKKYEEAASDFGSSIQLANKVSELYKLRGDACFMLNKNSEAISNYTTALSLEKDSKIKLNENILADLYNHFGESYFRQTNYSEALANFKNASRHNKISGEIYFNLGKTFLQTNELKDAESNLILAVQQDAHVPLWNFTLGLLYQKKGEYKEASEKYSSAILLDSNTSLGPDPVYNRGVCFAHENNFDNALKDYQAIEAKKEEARYPGFLNELGNILLEKKLSPDAEKCFRRSLLSDSSDAIAQYGIAIALVQQKQNDEALIWFEKSFSSGKIKKKRVTNDALVADIKEDKQFKKLIKKYL